MHKKGQASLDMHLIPWLMITTTLSVLLISNHLDDTTSRKSYWKLSLEIIMYLAMAMTVNAICGYLIMILHRHTKATFEVSFQSRGIQSRRKKSKPAQAITEHRHNAYSECTKPIREFKKYYNKPQTHTLSYGRGHKDSSVINQRQTSAFISKSTGN